MRLGEVPAAAVAPDAGAWRWFAVWALIGGVASFGVIGLMTIGLPLLLVSGGATAWLLTRRPASRVGGWGALCGAFVAPAFIAWTNRGGPGDVCHVTATETSCQQEWSPIPFVVVALLLLVAGVALFLGARRRDNVA